MIAIDVSPLAFQPRTGVARALEELLRGFDALQAPPPFVLVPPEHSVPAVSAREARRQMPTYVGAQGASVFLSPWSAFPRLEIPVVSVVHELPFVVHGPIEGKVRAWRHRTWLARGVRACAAVIVPSAATRADVLRLHPEAATRVHHVPNAFDPTPWLAARTEPADPPYAVMVGIGANRNMAAKKGLDVLLAAWREAAPPDWRLRLVGAPALELPAAVDVHAGLDDVALRSLVAHASLLVYPSRSEGFGYPPLEAFAAGVPVLTTDAGAIPEIVGDAAHVVEAGSVGALAAALKRLGGDRALRTSLVEAGTRRVRAFAPAESARRYADVLASVEVPA